MANNQSGRSWLRRAGSEVVDRLLLNNRGHDFNSGYWNTPGAIQGGIQGVTTMLGGPLAGLVTGMGINAYNNQEGDVGDVTRTDVPMPQMGVNAPNIATQPGMQVGSPNYGQLSGMVSGPSPFTAAGYNFANPSPGAGMQAPGGFANGIFAGGRGNFGPSGGPVAGAGGPRGSINYANQDAMNASIAATQQAMQDSRNGPSNARQSGGNIRGHSYGF